jgi:hypothetical protein
VLSNTKRVLKCISLNTTVYLLIYPINIGMGLHVSTLTESSLGPQVTDPNNNVYLLHCGIPNTTNIYCNVWRRMHSWTSVENTSITTDILINILLCLD